MIAFQVEAHLSRAERILARMKTALVLALSTASLLTVAGCSGAEGSDTTTSVISQRPGSNGGDCTGRVKYRGVVYRTSNAVNERAPVSEPVGSGDVVDCDETTVVDSVRVRAVEGVDVETAIATTDADWRAVYVNEDMASDPSSWPDVLRN
jgi:hypothetical protein